MTQQKVKAAPMDEIVFERRNKLYGAYLLRKLYNKHVTRALLLAIIILLAGLAYPLVSSYYAQSAKYIEKEATAEFISMDKPKEEAPPPPPPPPPPEALVEKVKFVAPVVTTEEVVEDSDIFNQDELNKNTVNEAVEAVAEEVAVAAQEVIDIPEEAKQIFTVVEENPSFPGGETELNKFLKTNLVYPQTATENGIQGTVYVSFVVDSKGNVTDAKVLRGIGGGCDEEALRVIRLMPQWHPGKQNGKTVRVLFNMPVYFKLSS